MDWSYFAANLSENRKLSYALLPKAHELQTLNRIVTVYLEFAELKAMLRQPMTMRDWITKLDEFLKISGQNLLDHAGKISAEVAKSKAEQEYRKHHAFIDTQPQKVDLEFEKAVKQLPKPTRSGKHDKKRET